MVPKINLHLEAIVFSVPRILRFKSLGSLRNVLIKKKHNFSSIKITSNYQKYTLYINNVINGGVTDHKTHCYDHVMVLFYIFPISKKIKKIVKKKYKSEFSLKFCSLMWFRV